MPADTVPTTYDALLVRCRELEDENAALKVKPPAFAITPATSRAIADNLLGKIARAAIAAPASKRGVRVIVSLGGYAFIGRLVDIVENTKAEHFAHVLLTEGAGEHAHPMLEVVRLDKVLLLPEGWL